MRDPQKAELYLLRPTHQLGLLSSQTFFIKCHNTYMKLRFICTLLAVLFLLTGNIAIGGQISPKILKQAVYAAARKQPTIPPYLSHNITHSLVRLYHPGGQKIIGTGFLLKYRHKLLAAFPHHIAGNRGQTWDIGLLPLDQKDYRMTLKVSEHGGFDEDTPDMSIIDLSSYELPGLQPLEMAAPQMDIPAYSFGYTFGDTDADHFLPLERNLLTEQGWEITTDRYLPAEIPEQPVDLAGYCGSPLLQRQYGGWKVVGMHLGSCVYGAGNYDDNIAFAVNLSKALPLLQNLVLPHIRPILFRGVTVDYLHPGEFIKSLEIERNGVSVFWVAGSHRTNIRRLESLVEKEITLQPEDHLNLLISDGTSDRWASMPLP